MGGQGRCPAWEVESLPCCWVHHAGGNCIGQPMPLLLLLTDSQRMHCCLSVYTAICAQLAAAQLDAQRSKQRAAAVAARLGQVRQELAAAGKVTTVQAQALVTTLKVMQGADRWALAGGCGDT